MNMPATLVWLGASISMLAVGKEDDPRFSPEADRACQSLRYAIKADWAALGDQHPWVGEYFNGRGLGDVVELRLAPSGFIVEWHGCVAGRNPIDRNYGTVAERDGVLKFEFVHPNRAGHGALGIPDELVPVAWGERRYLVPRGKMEMLCKFARNGTDPGTKAKLFFWVRSGDDERPLSGVPRVPPRYRGLVLRDPILAPATLVGQAFRRDQPELGACDVRSVVLEAGSKQGLEWGMSLCWRSPTGHIHRATIVRVDDSSCTAELTQPAGDEEAPGRGAMFSTHVPERRP